MHYLWRYTFGALALLLLPACSAVLNFDQCKTDADCVRGASSEQTLYCTSDHICVSDVPSERLCVVSSVSSTRSDAVTIAGLFRRTGSNDVVDTNVENAVILAVEQINTIGATRPLRLVLCDTANDPDQAKKALITAAERFSAVAAVGPTSSSEAVALAASPDFVVQKHDFLIVSCSATAPSVTSLADDNLIWRTAASDTLQSEVLSRQVPLSTSRAAAAFIKSPYGQGLSDAFAAALAVRFSGANFNLSSEGFDEGAAGANVVASLARTSPQVALIVADSDAPTWVAALNDGGTPLSTTRFLLTDGSKAPALFSLNPSKSVLSRITGTAPATPSGQAYNVFKGSYMSRFNGIDPSSTAFVANAYDATYAIAIAMGAVPTTERITGRALISGMQRISTRGAPSIRVGPGEFSSAYQELARGGSVNLDGTSGPIDFDPNTGDVLSAAIEVWNIDSSGNTPVFHTVENITP